MLAVSSLNCTLNCGEVARFLASICTSLLLGIFLRFLTKEHVLKVNKSKINGENVYNEYHFDIEYNYESGKEEKTFFRFFWRFLTFALILRLPNTSIYVFKALFGFCNL